MVLKKDVPSQWEISGADKTSVSAGWLYLFWNDKLAHLKIVFMDSRPPRRQERTTESLIYHLTSIPAIKFMSKTDLGPVNTSKNTFKSEDFFFVFEKICVHTKMLKRWKR